MSAFTETCQSLCRGALLWNRNFLSRWTNHYRNYKCLLHLVWKLEWKYRYDNPDRFHEQPWRFTLFQHKYHLLQRLPSPCIKFCCFKRADLRQLFAGHRAFRRSSWNYRLECHHEWTSTQGYKRIIFCSNFV